MGESDRPPPATDDPAVEANGVTKSFRVGDERIEALSQLTARIARGGLTGLVGSDAAGKTTFMRLIAGLLLPDKGRVTVLGLDTSEASEGLRGRVSYMPQRFGLYEDLTVAENLDLYADLYALPTDERKSRYAELMEFTGLDPFRSRLAGRLSGGMKQKLGLACTLVHPPELLLLDEPSVGVDPVSRRELWQIVRRLSGGGMTVVWSTAYQDEAERCDEVIVLHKGQELANGCPADLIAPLQNRAFSLPVPPADRGRAARRAKKLTSVLDAVVQGRNVRVLLREGAKAPRPQEILPGGRGLPGQLTPSAARFEDFFVSLLKEREGVVATPESDNLHEADVGAPIIPESPAKPDHEKPVIEIHDLTRVFGDFRAVDQMTFSVPRGEIFGLLGPNGAGKSTTFRMLCGLLPASSGEARVLGFDLRRSAPRARARIGYMSQKFALYGALSARQNMHFFAGAYGLALDRIQSRISWALDSFRLEEEIDRLSDDLPLGYKQRLALATALLHEPEILFLDEPTSGVDPLTRREFWDRISRLADSGVTVLVTTHFLDEAEYCDRIGIVYRGRLIALGSPDELKEAYRQPDHPDPTLDDTFVALIESYERDHPQ